jgi:ABC-type antimicrobial peptide transport system permease subunit
LRTSGSSELAGRIVAIVGDARERGLDREPGPTVYSCMSAPNPTPYFLVRTHGDPAALISAIRRGMKEIEPLRSVYDAAPLQDRLGDAFKENRLRAFVLAMFAASALLLACVGLYGTVSYVVSLRRREIGVRMAIGATRSGIVRFFVAQGARVAATGCLVGLGLSLGSGRVLSGMLYGVTASDPLTLSGVTGLVLTVASLAVLVPSARAAFVDPTKVLRDQ